MYARSLVFMALGLVLVPRAGGAAAPPTFADDVAFLQAHAPVRVLTAPSGARVAVSAAYQGRVMTSAVEAGGASLGWINRAFIAAGKTGTAFDNYGGEDRFWLGPEGGQYGLYFPPAKPFAFSEWQTPHVLQEGGWDVKDAAPDHVTFTRAMTLTNYSGARFALDVERLVRLLPDADVARHLGIDVAAAKASGAKWVAFETVNRITNRGSEAWTRDHGLLSIWILAMYAPSPDAHVLIPFERAAAGTVVNDAYFGKVPPDRLAVREKEGHLVFKCDGLQRGKIGLPPARAREVLGSYSASARLLTLVHYDKPKGASDYVNSMWEIQKEPYGGDVVNSYNDGSPGPGLPPLGGFYEVETSSPAAALRPGESMVHSHRTFHFVGERAVLDKVAERALGVSASRIAEGVGGSAGAAPVRVESGLLEGAPGSASRGPAYKGIPFAAPPVGDLRWKPPEPVVPWSGVRNATEFGSRCTQGRIYDDMVFRDEASEDCLYLNIWTPAKPSSKALPVMVWIHGGGFVAGSASEPRQDGERLAEKGVIVVGINYRLGVFGFLAHPELTKESSHGASGNYGLLDQVAALQWVQKNIAAFGGDPANVTIFGESAGSFAVSALMASPLAQGLFQRAIGESGAFFTVGDGTLVTSGHGTLVPKTLSASEEMGQKLAASTGADSLAALRAKPADEVLKASIGERPWFGPNIDGYMLPQIAYVTFAAGKQSHVPLLAGWNADEDRSAVTLTPEKPTAKSFADQARARFGDSADAILKAYSAASDAEALESAASLGSDLFIGYSTWKWIEMHAATGGSPVFRYSFDRVIPIAPDPKNPGVTAKDIGARHAGEIEYVFGALASSPNVPWEPVDHKLSDLMMSYWSNFARTGDPNGAGLPTWPRYDKEAGHPVLHLGDTPQASPDARRPRYEALDAFTAKLR